MFIELHNPRRQKRSAFTLVEIMVVVVIIGLLSAMAIPAFSKVRTNSNATKIVNDFRIFRDAFELHCFESGAWAPDGNGNNLPATVVPYVDISSWSSAPISGTRWDWEQNRLGYVAALALVFDEDRPEIFALVDEKLDDGDFGAGSFVKAGDRYLYILEK